MTNEMRRILEEQIAQIIQENSGDIAYGYSNERVEDFVKAILLPIADKILHLLESQIEQAKAGDNP
jgi:hypothetical protein